MGRRVVLRSVLVLAVLAIVAIALSVAAVWRFSSAPPVTAEPAASVQPDSADSETEPQSEPQASPQPSDQEPADEPDPSKAPTDGPVVVVLGDSHSLGADVWVEAAGAELGWGRVVNLSAPGRGYLAVPRECIDVPCANFYGSIGAVTEQAPDVVLVFGGTADGDYDIGPAATQFFSELRAQLPEADVVAISPVSTDDPTPYWITMHTQNIQQAAAAINGTFVDAGQPARGEAGPQLSAQAHEQIADEVVEALR